MGYRRCKVTELTTKTGTYGGGMDSEGHPYTILNVTANILTPTDDIRPLGTQLYTFCSVFFVPWFIDLVWREYWSAGAFRKNAQAPPPLDGKCDVIDTFIFFKTECLNIMHCKTEWWLVLMIVPAAITYAVGSIVFGIFLVPGYFVLSWVGNLLRNLGFHLLTQQRMENNDFTVKKCRSDDGNLVLRLHAVVHLIPGTLVNRPDLPESLGVGDEFDVGFGPCESFCLFRNSKSPEARGADSHSRDEIIVRDESTV